MARMIICKRCKRERKHLAKDLCASCYARLKQIEQGDDWLRRHAESERKRRKKLGPEYRRRERERNKRRKEWNVKYGREWRQKNNEYKKQKERDYRKREPQQHRARDAVHTEIRAGRMPSPLTLQCSGCDEPATDYHHHRGYEEKFKLDVIPLCKPCHGKTNRID